MSSKFLTSIKAIPPFAGKTTDWRVAPEPKLGLLALSALSIVPALLVGWLFVVLPVGLYAHKVNPAVGLLGIFFAIVVHELLHGVAGPDFGLSEKTLFGLDTKLGIPFCVYLGPVTKPRMQVMYLLPFFVLTVVPLFAAALGYSNGFLCVVAITNASGAVVDLVSSLFVAIKVPRDAVFIADGARTVYLSRSELARSAK
jgi:hypothetical protein